jgi:hypothetical protein
VLLVDDSIVRGTTSKQIIQMAREAGARKVYLASAAPPVRYPNVYGIDMPSPDELVAHGRSESEVEQYLGCDWLIYQELGDLVASVADGNDDLRQFDTSCFSGEYVTGWKRATRRSRPRSRRRCSTRSATAGCHCVQVRPMANPRCGSADLSDRNWLLRARWRSVAWAAKPVAPVSCTPSPTSSSTRSTWPAMRPGAFATCRSSFIAIGSTWLRTRHGISPCCARG